MRCAIACGAISPTSRIQQELALSVDAISAEDPAPIRRRSRLGLYLPFGLLVGLAILWSIGWVVIREQARGGLDKWITDEAQAGRRWSCADRSFGGYPFRLEIRCSDFSLDRPDVHASLGPLLVVGQIYQPRHVIAEMPGPMRVEAGPNRAEGSWRLLQASVMVADRGFDRISLVVDDPTVRIEGPLGMDLASRRFEAHLRADPAKPDAYDLAILSNGALIPGMNELIGGEHPTDIRITLDITQSRDLPARPLWSELERWRLAGGKIDVTSVSLTKGPRRAEAAGTLGIDEQHRVQGQIDIRAANLGGLVGRLVGNGGGFLDLLLGGGRPPSDTPKPGRDAGAPLKAMPPIRFDNGRIYLGPIAIPGVRLTPLY